MAPGVLRVLLVEDQTADAKLVELALGGAASTRFRVVRVSRVSEAVARIGTTAFDAVLLDLGLPDSQGLDGLARVRQASPTTAVVVLSGSQDPTRGRAALVAGAQRFETKRVYRRGELERAIRSAVARAKAEAEFARGGAISEAAGRELGALADGVIAFDRGRVAYVNDAGAALWATLTVSDAPLARSIVTVAGPNRSGPSVCEELVFRRLDGSGVRLRYLVRRTPSADGRALLYLERLEPDPGVEGPRRPRESAREGARPSTPPPVIDPSAWRDLGELARGDPTFVPSLVRVYLEEGGRLFAEVNRAAQDAEMRTVGRIAHNLKSASAQVGALSLSRTLARLERAAERAEAEQVEERLREAVDEFVRVGDALHALAETDRDDAGG